MSAGLLLALPKGRIARELAPVLSRAGIEPEAAFADEHARQLRFATSDQGLDLIQVRSFDVATFVAFGAAQLGVVGNDVLMEFDYREIYAPLDLGIGLCRMVVAEPAELATGDDPSRWSHVRVATKYPQVTRRHFAARGVQAECIKLNGAMGARAGAGALPQDRRSGRHRRDAQGQRPGRGGAYRRCLRPAGGQSHRAQDPSRRAPGLDRALRRGGEWHIGWIARARVSPQPSTPCSQLGGGWRRMSTGRPQRSWMRCAKAAMPRCSTTPRASTASRSLPTRSDSRRTKPPRRPPPHRGPCGTRSRRRRNGSSPSTPA